MANSIKIFHFRALSDLADAISQALELGWSLPPQSLVVDTDTEGSTLYIMYVVSPKVRKYGR